ncbi:hypothetical protein PCANB_001193 [Pneumocystis canis]|nr:hypothetical protein PCANB_001193 [Pneumocystis canis]
MGKGQWKRMLPDFAPSDAIWRNDMDDFVLTQFRKRIIIELKNIQKYFIDIELMNNMFTYDIKNNKLNKKIGCIIHKFDDDRIWCLEKVERQEFKVPVINSFILFDINDNEDEWLKILISKKSIAIPLGIDTVNAIFWIWKFRSYF